jgi:hypothetical protein
MLMSRYALPHIDNIVKIHTDGMMTLKEIPELKLSDKLGDWKVKQYKKVIIHNKTKCDKIL